jgi:hypothetical protein
MGAGAVGLARSMVSLHHLKNQQAVMTPPATKGQFRLPVDILQNVGFPGSLEIGDRCTKFSTQYQRLISHKKFLT